MTEATKLLDLVAVYENVLDLDFCKLLVDEFEKVEDSRRQLIRTENHMQFDQINIHSEEAYKPYIPQLAAVFKQAREAYFNSTVPEGLGLEAELEPIRIKRYLPNDRDSFPVHIDAADYPSSKRYLVMFVYLNDVEEGGETTFTRLGVKVKPKAGSILMFPPHWMFPHAGEKPISGPKYILSTYLRHPQKNK